MIQHFEYIIYALCFVVWITSILRNLAYRRICKKVERSRTAPTPDTPLPGLSVIITAHDQCDALRRNLPLILNQIYSNFEVIVVDINSTDGTKELLEKMEEDYPRLYHTFTPSTSRDISPQRLAMTLGVKASNTPWLVFTQADCCPISHQWLRRLGEAIASHRSAKMAVGYTRYNHSNSYAERKNRFFRFWQQVLTLNFANNHGVYKCDGTNLVYNKELFLSHQGFASHSVLLTGATDIMVNQNSTLHNSTICVHPEAIMEQEMPLHKDWHQEHRFFQETRLHFTNKFKYRMRYAGSVLLHISMVTIMLCNIGLSLWLKQYIVGGVVLFLWLVHFFEQGLILRRVSRVLENHNISVFSVAWYIHLIPFWDLRSWFAHRFSDKRQYRKKYI